MKGSIIMKKALLRGLIGFPIGVTIGYAITIAFSWQAEAHKPQPVHFSSSIFTIFLIIIHLTSSVLRFYFIITWSERMLLKQQNSNKLKI